MRTRDEVGALNKGGGGPNFTLVEQGKKLGIEVLKTAVHAGGWDAAEGMLAVVHESFPLPAASAAPSGASSGVRGASASGSGSRGSWETAMSSSHRTWR